MRNKLGWAAAGVFFFALASGGCDSFGGPKTAMPASNVAYGGAPAGSGWGANNNTSWANASANGQQQNGYATAGRAPAAQNGIAQASYNNQGPSGTSGRVNRDDPPSKPYNPQTGGFDRAAAPRWPEDVDNRDTASAPQQVRPSSNDRYSTPPWPPANMAPATAVRGNQNSGAAGQQTPAPAWPDSNANYQSSNRDSQQMAPSSWPGAAANNQSGNRYADPPDVANVPRQTGYNTQYQRGNNYPSNRGGD